MQSVRFGDVSHLYWQVSKAVDNGRNPSYQQVRDALDNREITDFLDQYSEVDLSLYGNDPICTQAELDAILERYSAASPNDLSLSSNPNGLLYLQGVIVELLQSDEWQDDRGQNIKVTDLEMGI